MRFAIFENPDNQLFYPTYKNWWNIRWQKFPYEDRFLKSYAFVSRHDAVKFIEKKVISQLSVKDFYEKI